MVAGALEFAPGNMLLYFGILAVGIYFLTNYLISKAEKKGKKVWTYWKAYKSKMLILGILFILFGLFKLLF